MQHVSNMTASLPHVWSVACEAVLNSVAVGLRYEVAVEVIV